MTKSAKEVESQQWNPSQDLLAESLHFVLGLSFPLAATVLGFPSYIGAILIMSISAIKDFTFDPKVKGGTIIEGFRDFGFYGTGALVGMTISGIGKSNVKNV